MSGKSIHDMNAIATALNVRYFAVAHDGVQAHAFTFYSLLWEVSAEKYVDFEDKSECLCETNSFTDGRILQRRKESKEMCGCSENACRRKESYKRKFGEDNDRRWAVYERVSKSKETSEHYVTKESLAITAIQDLTKKIDYWKEKAVTRLEEIKSCELMANEIRNEIKNYQTFLAIVIAVLLCLGVACIRYG